jgi:hypothetical protein
VTRLPRAEARRAVASCLVWVVVAVGHTGCSRPSPDGAAYRAFYTMPRSATPQPRGTLKGDFDWAASAPTLGEASERWHEFLRAHPPDGEYEDAFQRNHVRAAQYELMRVEYLRGRVQEGDKLLNQLEDVRRSP